MRTFGRGRLSRTILAITIAVVVGCSDDDPARPPANGGGTGPVSFNSFQSAAVAVGQPNKTSGSNNAGGTTNAGGLSGPVGGGCGSFYVADQFNNRVLGFSGIPSSDGAVPAFVLGQTDFTSNSAGLSAQAFNAPLDCVVSGGKLFLVDSFNSRVLIWNSLPTGNVPADHVVGQSDFASGGSQTTQSGLSFPTRVVVVGGRMIIADFFNNRVLIWNSIPTINGAPADLVVGQSDFTSSGSGLTASTFGNPHGAWSDGNRLVICDSVNDRVLIWNTMPTSNGQSADVVVGAADFTSQGENGALATSIGDPWGVASDGTSLFVADSDFNRVLIYTPFPTSNGAAATAVLGQGSFSNRTRNDDDQNNTDDIDPTARTLSSPSGVRVAGNRLLVADQGNHRVLVFYSQ